MVFYLFVILYKLLVMGDFIVGKYVGGIFNILLVVFIRVILKWFGGVEVWNVLWMDKYCCDFICYFFEVSCIFSVWKKREREIELIIIKYEI